MDKDRDTTAFGSWFPRRDARHRFEDKLQYLLTAEEQILRAISARAPLPGILNAICCALDCQIGNMVSLISLPTEQSSNLSDIAKNAKLFGLHVYFSTDMVSGKGEELGFLEMYCCVPRHPSIEERQLIERAVSLAAIAIQHYNEAGKKTDLITSGMRLSQEFELQWPVCAN